MTVLAALTGFCVALLLVLGWVVLMLRRDVTALRAELRAVDGRSEPPGIPLPDATSPVAEVDPQVAEPVPEPPPSVRTVVTLDGREDDDQPNGEGRPEEVPVITQMAQPVDDVDLTTRRVASVTLARPLIKVASLSYGVRRALDDEHRLRVRLTMKRELKRQRKMRRRQRTDRTPSQGWTQ